VRLDADSLSRDVNVPSFFQTVLTAIVLGSGTIWNPFVDVANTYTTSMNGIVTIRIILFNVSLNGSLD
jgi:hypothetical protein